MELDRMNRQIQLKDDGTKNLKNINETLKSKCHLLETELESALEKCARALEDVDSK